MGQFYGIQKENKESHLKGGSLWNVPTEAGRASLPNAGGKVDTAARSILNTEGKGSEGRCCGAGVAGKKKLHG